MRILLACETSNITSKAFRKKGHYVISCDKLPNDEDQTYHHIGDVLDIMNEGFDLMIGHPPCPRLAKSSGAHWKKDWFIKEQYEAIEFVKKMMNAKVNHICIENPIGKISTAIRRPDQIVHPYYFGDPYLKETCFWLKNLPLLRATNIVRPIANWVKPGNKRKRRFSDVVEGGGNNWKDRSRSFEGIANAMADQWGSGQLLISNQFKLL